ncbi:bifunctional riboflavin kinase/FMN adenylyltransferase [Leifsonia xyli subsp. xyli]|uniref:Riboflavin biosynthesis protein n=2 Tax=Leifsonia xyli subsp. xyli TaxID=59736 RepID=Q6AG39_LEIXX|nr:bifunctional riboflavin kinase/FAD synthetase [Leifsonia xyli]AAT88656.1 riboflavin kinase/ FMN adenyltransferase [Leifsonia xyli subsp. xyli str. CTCB07]ODA90811.1 bifunctional riboflavin kinase/FMN adenylyltransferase [Leifsonia xyli subsp. xyli]
MKVFTAVADVPAGYGPSAVTIGKFDGVHTGHRAVIARLRQVADERGLAATVITFDRNPLEVIAPEKCPPALVSNRQKLDLLAGTGIDATLMVPFDRALAELSPDEFVRRILVDRLRAAVVLVGSDFRYGRGGAGDVAFLRERGEQYGFAVELIDDVRPERGRRVSSTWIRELLAEGDVAHAALLLGQVPTVRGVVVHGAVRGRELGFPTANLSPELEGLIPADGVYAGFLTDDGQRWPSAISVGNNPTFEGVPHKQVEAYALDRELDLYGHTVELAFHERIRGMVAYAGVEPLIAQIRDDVERARRILAPGAAE